MLKIKENVDLKILKEYGFIFKTFEPWNYQPIYEFAPAFDLIVDSATREIKLDYYCELTEKNYRKAFDVIYSLIQDGLVERI